MTDRPNNQDAGITEPMHPSDDELSAYLNRDDADTVVRRRLEAHLERCAECRERLAELRTVVRLLRSAEHPVPTRSFRLDPSRLPAQLPAPAPEPTRIEPWIVRAQPALRRITAIAAVLLVLLVTGDVLTHRDSSKSESRETAALSSANQASDSTSVMSAGAAESASESTAASLEVPAEATAASSGGGSSSAGSSGDERSTAVSGESFAQSTTTSSVSDAAQSDEASTPEPAALAVPQTEASGQPPVEAAAAPETATQGGRSYWRLLELAVGVVVIWLLFLTVVLPRLPYRRRS